MQFQRAQNGEKPNQEMYLLMSLLKVSVRMGEVEGLTGLRPEAQIKEPKSRWHMSPWRLLIHPVRQLFIFILVWSVHKNQSL